MDLTDAQLDRYARHIVLKEIGGAGQQRLLGSHVALVGAGGIGSPAIQYLAAAGIGRLTLIDDDRVDLSNLQRQTLYSTRDVGATKVAMAANVVQRLNPDVQIVPTDRRIDAVNAAEFLAGADVVIDGSDSFATRLAVADAAHALRIPLVSAAVAQFDGQLGVYRGWEADKPCYRCLVGTDPARPDGSCADQGVLGALTGILGSLAAMETIRQIVPFGVDSAGTLLLIDSLAFRFRTLALPHGLGSCWSSPIRGHDGVLGTFAVYHGSPHRPDERERRLVARFTDLSAVALEHDRLYGALGESEERFRRVFEDNAVGMALTDLDGRFLKVNDALATMLGHPPAALLARDLDVVLLGADRAAARDLLGRLADGAAPTGPLEVGLVRADGATVQAALTVSLVGAGRSRHASLNVVDVTARRAAQRDRTARREAELAARVAEDASRAKSELLSTLSHELRTPLQAIIGFAELLGTLELPPERQVAALGHIDAAARHVLDLVGDVLDLARLEARALPLAPGEVDLGALVHEVLALLEPVAARRGIRLHTDLPVVGGPTAWADPRRVRQVLINLVTNGVRHNDVDGWVRVDADGGAVTVADGGPGIPPGLLDRLFLPFTQAGGSDEAGGAGLGLALVHGLVTAMAGEVSVDSAPGEGTVMTVRLPVAASGGSSIAATGGSSIAAFGGSSIATDGSDIAAGVPGPGVRSGRG